MVANTPPAIICRHSSLPANGNSIKLNLPKDVHSNDAFLELSGPRLCSIRLMLPRHRRATRRNPRMKSARATYYGPGLFGRRSTNGKVLRPSTVGIAHRTLPLGTKVMFLYKDKSATARVIDRGPFKDGVTFDLTLALRKKLGFPKIGTIQYRVIRK